MRRLHESEDNGSSEEQLCRHPTTFICHSVTVYPVAL